VNFISLCLISLFTLVAGVSCSTDQAPPESTTAASYKLLEVASFPKTQPTGVAVSRRGRIFVNFPRWWDTHGDSVVEVQPDGALKPYPDQTWNRWDPSLPPGERFVCVQSVYVDQNDFLWILDPASPQFAGVLPGGPKLVKVDLAQDKVIQVIRFDETVAPKRSYLNDVRVDAARKFAYLTDSGLGALIVVNLITGKAWRALDNHPSTKAEPNLTLTIGGKKWANAQGKTPQVHADGIALDYQGRYLYYHALTGKALYRVNTKLLREERISPTVLGSKVEHLGDTGAVDGLVMDRFGNVYLSVLEENAIKRFTSEGALETLVQDNRISWPDSFAVGPDGYLYFTTSRIHLMPRFNQGVDRRTSPYHIYKINIGAPRWQDPKEN
jgi:sugar lactone lactonase YvrE